MTASGNLSANGVVDFEPATARGPGAPKGRAKPPGSGRQKGTPNKITREIREVASKYTLRAVKQAWKLAEGAKDQTVQLKALELILAYGHGRPSSTTLIGGDGGDPLKLQQVQDLMADPEEAARRVSLLLYQGNPEFRAARDAEREARRNGQGAFPESFTGTQAPAGESAGSAGPDTPVSEKAPQESVEAADGASEPKPPPEGQSLWFGLLEVRNVGPVRDGLPYMYAVRRAEQELKRSNWDTSLAQVRKLIGEPLPPGRLAETRPDGALPRPSPREQRSSGPELPQVSRHRHKGRRLLTMPFHS